MRFFFFLLRGNVCAWVLNSNNIKQCKPSEYFPSELFKRTLNTPHYPVLRIIKLVHSIRFRYQTRVWLSRWDVFTGLLDKDCIYVLMCTYRYTQNSIGRREKFKWLFGKFGFVSSSRVIPHHANKNTEVFPPAFHKNIPNKK